jgi:hypothetical protein
LQFRRRIQREEELGAIAVRAFIRHTQQTSPIELKSAMKFILKELTIIERANTAMTAAGRVASLDYEAWDKSVEDGVRVVAIETVL